MKELRYAPKADRDLLDIWAYTADRWSPVQADTYLSQILDALDKVAAGRLRGAPIDPIAKGYRRLIVGSHTAFYSETETHVTVIRVLHQGMDADRHLD